MKRVSALILSALFPVLCNAATPWQKWGGTHVRLGDDGNIGCAALAGGAHCDWSNSDAVPAASAPALMCGSTLLSSIWGMTGYDRPNHWCNNAFGDYFAVWKRGDYFGYNAYFAENPAGDLMCASNDGVNCAWGSVVNHHGPEKPVKPLVCGAAHDAVWGSNTSKPAGHWCQRARYTQDERDYADPKWANETFLYTAGWAGSGFGLTGTQRGAPESLTIVEQDGRKGLALMSKERDAAWFQKISDEGRRITPKNTLYTTADKEPQDDLFMYSATRWVAAEAPAVVMHVYVPAGNTTSLRMPVIFMRNGVETTMWPGIWLGSDGVRLRTAGGDYPVQSLASTGKTDSWWTLGLKITETGDIEYYASPDWRISPFEQPLLRGRQSELLGTHNYSVLRQADALVMMSSVIRNSSPVILQDIRYGKKTPGQLTGK